MPDTTSKNVAPAVLLVDDEAQFLQSASFALRSSGIANVVTCNDSREVLDVLAQREFATVLLDVLMPHRTGRDLLPLIVNQHPGIAVIMVTAVNEIEIAVECIKNGAFDYLVKPVEKVRLVTTIQKAFECGELKRENSRLKQSLLTEAIQQPAAFEEICTCSSTMLAIFRYIEAIAPTALPVLITGETGSGKELMARAVHKASGRSGKFVAVNVGGLDDTLLSDTLFGHEKGAFTGADRRREGLIAQAGGGTLFLDEIGELSPQSQVKLLRLIEERAYFPVGADRAIPTDARIVVATNAAVNAAIDGGSFRKDLYFRLQSHHIEIPPLRKRKEDIDLLLEFFLEKSAAELGKNTPTPPDELSVLLNTYDFPGNVRELRGMVYDAVSRHTGGVLSMETFKSAIYKKGTPLQQPPLAKSDDRPSVNIVFGDKLPTFKDAEQQLLDEALKRAKGNQSIAAQMLGITRSALNKRLSRA
jgi:two-component system, NtrC family, nitrogen regulation response regulator GlnG